MDSAGFFIIVIPWWKYSLRFSRKFIQTHEDPHGNFKPYYMFTFFVQVHVNSSYHVEFHVKTFTWNSMRKSHPDLLILIAISVVYWVFQIKKLHPFFPSLTVYEIFAFRNKDSIFSLKVSNFHVDFHVAGRIHVDFHVKLHVFQWIHVDLHISFPVKFFWYNPRRFPRCWK